MNSSKYKILGEYIERCEERNSGLKYSVEYLRGVNNEGKVCDSKAKTDGIDFSPYKVVHKGEFIYNPARLDLGSIARFDGDACIVSTLYVVFRVREDKLPELMPEYLDMWLKRPEFHRFVGYVNWGSAREYFWYENIAEVQVPIPDIATQRRIVAEYQTVEKRIATNEQLIAKLEDTAHAIYKKMFVDDIDPAHLPEGWHKRQLIEVAAIKGGKRLPKGEDLVDYKTSHPYIKVADMPKCRYIQLTDSFQYVTDEVQDNIKRYIVNEGDVIISIVGTIGNVNIVGGSLDRANLTENCMKICQNKGYTNLIYSFLTSDEGKRQIEQGTVGGVQGKLPMYNVEKLELVIPNADGLRTFNDRIDIINNRIKSSRSEILLLQQMSDLLLSKLS